MSQTFNAIQKDSLLLHLRFKQLRMLMVGSTWPLIKEHILETFKNVSIYVAQMQIECSIKYIEL